MADNFIYQKLADLFKKHSQDGATPKKIIEANLAREFRLSKIEIQKVLQEMNLSQANMRKRRLKRENHKSRDTDPTNLREIHPD